MKAQWRRLSSTENAEWGVKVFHDDPFDAPSPGDTITVEKKDGSTSEVELKHAVFSGEEPDGSSITIFAINRAKKGESE